MCLKLLKCNEYAYKHCIATDIDCGYFIFLCGMGIAYTIYVKKFLNYVGRDFVNKLIVAAEIVLLLFLVTKNMKMTKKIKILKKQKPSK